MRVWIGCLACYNAGFLIGNWHDANEAGEVTTQELHAAHNITTDEAGYVQGAEVYGPHEELWCMDIEDMPPGFDREMSPMEAQEIADAYDEIQSVLAEDEIPAYFAMVEDSYGTTTAGDLADHVQDFQDRYAGTWNSVLDYAYEYVDSVGLLGDDDSIASRYFDYQAFARDLAFDLQVIDAGGAGVHIFYG